MENKIIHTRKRYLALAAVFVLMGLVLVFLPDKDNSKQLKPEKLLINLQDNSRLISTDEVADRLINKDPSLLLIDVRPREEFEKSTLPGAMNIPLTEILSEESLKVFNRKAYDKVIFANNDVLAEQAWVLLAGKLVERSFLMSGGINRWLRTIIQPEAPDESAPQEAFELYHQRVASSRYFSGQSKAFEYVETKGSGDQAKKSTNAGVKKAAPALPPPPPPAEEEEEGC